MSESQPRALRSRDASPAPLRCVDQCRQLDLRPAGTTPSADGVLLVELPLPWPADIADDPRLGGICAAAVAGGHRVQAVVPARKREQQALSVIRYGREPGQFGTFARHEAAVDDAAELGAAAIDLLRRPADLATGDARPVDVLVCGHGKRDVCCGSSGVPLACRFAEIAPPGVRVWRTSHLGGHRFAPTALTLPDGRSWAALDPELLLGIVTRRLPPPAAAAHDRGCAAFADPWQQAADGAVLAVEGWDWLSVRRTASTEPAPSTITSMRHVGLRGERPDGSLVGYRVLVELTRQVPVPICGRPLAEASKASPEFAVREVEASDDVPSVTG